MKKLLPISQRFGVNSTKSERFTLRSKTTKGFTLIELLVVIAIIAIIAVVAIALFANVQADARDGKRRAELESIANALEVNKTTAGYVLITSTMFGGGVWPGAAGCVSNCYAQDPSNYPYCIYNSNTQGNAAVGVGWTNTSGAGLCPSPYVKIDGVTAMSGTQYKICVRLENRGTTGLAYCRTNVQ